MKSSTYFLVRRPNQKTELWQIEPPRRLADLGIGIESFGSRISQESFHFDHEQQTLAIRYEDGRAYLLDLAWLEATADASPPLMEIPSLLCWPYGTHLSETESRNFQNLLNEEEYLGAEQSRVCPESVLLVGQAQAAAYRQNSQRAIELFEQALARDPNLKIDPATEAAHIANIALVREARRLIRIGELDVAAEKFLEVRSQDPQVEIDRDIQNLVQKRLSRGRAYIQSSEFVNATLEFDALNTIENMFGIDALAEERKRDAAQGYIAFGEALAKDGQGEEATAAFAKALTFDPNQDIEPDDAKRIAAQTWLERGRALASTLDIEAAVQAFATAQALDSSIQIDPKAEAEKIGADLLVSQGRRLAKWGHAESALAKFKKAQALYPPLELDPVAEVTRLAPTATPIAESPLATPASISTSPLATPTMTPTKVPSGGAE